MVEQMLDYLVKAHKIRRLEKEYHFTTRQCRPKKRKNQKKQNQKKQNRKKQTQKK